MAAHISIIIPCYNTKPEFIKEAIDSVKKYKGKYSYNIIVVDDGSTNESTLHFLKNINDSTIQIITQENRGLAGARNTGVRNSESEYILFLDSDDRLKPEYIEKGAELLLTNSKTGVVYSRAEPFGDGSRVNLHAAPFDIVLLLTQNHVPSCAVIRRSAWDEVNGFDENMRKYEDWEFWIRIYKAGWEFRFIDAPMFEYRIHESSLLGQSGEEDFRNALAYIYKKHWELVYNVYYKLYATRIIYQNDMKRPFRSLMKYIRYNFRNKQFKNVIR